MILKPSPVSTRRVSCDTDAGLMVAEISDFGANFDFGRVYDDACDEGLTLVSHKTGREVVYAMDRVERDREGDLMFWQLIPANPRERFLPALRVYND